MAVCVCVVPARNVFRAIEPAGAVLTNTEGVCGSVKGENEMGEYASYGGSRVKIGTCESMYYLRADQARMVRPLEGNVDPVRDRDGIRFRFPFPAEDDIAPGQFDYPLPEVVVDYPTDLPSSHDTVMVQHGEGSRRLSATLPCPMVAPEIWHAYVQGYTPKVLISYQGHRNGHLAVIVTCAYCGGMWNLSEKADAERFVAAIRSQADGLQRVGQMRLDETHRRHGTDCGDGLAEREMRQAEELHTIADRIMAGYSATRVLA